MIRKNSFWLHLDEVEDFIEATYRQVIDEHGHFSDEFEHIRAKRDAIRSARAALDRGEEDNAKAIMNEALLRRRANQ